MAPGFSLCPIIPYRSGFCQLSRQLDRGPLDSSVPSVCRPYQRQIKSRLNALAVLKPCLFLSLILPGRRWTLNLQTFALPLPGVARRGVRRLPPRSAVIYNAGPSSCRSCMPCKMSCYVFTLQLAFSLRSPWLRPSRPPQHGHRLQ